MNVYVTPVAFMIVIVWGVFWYSALDKDDQENTETDLGVEMFTEDPSSPTTVGG